MDVFDAAERYRHEGRQLIILAGKDYGSGSSRDWAAKGPWMQVIIVGFPSAIISLVNICKEVRIRALLFKEFANCSHNSSNFKSCHYKLIYSYVDRKSGNCLKLDLTS